MSDPTTSSATPPTLWWDKAGEVYDCERLYQAMMGRCDHPVGGRGLSTGWPLLDEFFTLRKKQLTIISGIPNHGKSEWMDALTVNSIAAHQWRWAIFSPENFPYDDHLEKIVEKLAGCRYQEIPRVAVQKILAKLQQYIFWIYPKGATLAAIADIWKNLIVERQVDAVLLDPWNTVEHKRPREQSETEYIGEALSVWIDFARTMNVAVFIIAHPTKIPVNRDTGLPYLMNGYDISGSANWVNKPDNVIVVQRPDFSEPITTIHIQKIRDQRHTGRRGAVRFRYDALRGGLYTAQEVITR